MILCSHCGVVIGYSPSPLVTDYLTYCLKCIHDENVMKDMPWDTERVFSASG